MNQPRNLPLISPTWPAPQGVGSASSTRAGGVSKGPFDSLNLGLNTGDQRIAVLENRALLMRALGLKVQPHWMNQVHGTTVVQAENCVPEPQSDACFASSPGQVCVVLTADCLPVLLCDRNGSCVAAAHAGWRGLANGIIASTCDALPAPRDQLIAWIGPGIGPQAYEVGPMVRESFSHQEQVCDECFVMRADSMSTKWMANLFHIARLQLIQAGVTEIYGGDYCTFTDPARFFSHRRAAPTGRMATLIWLND